MFEFETEVQLNITGSTLREAGSGKVKVKWVFEMEMRSNGIKDFSVSVPDQTITTFVERYDEETDEEFAEEITLELKNVKAETSFSHSSKDIKYLHLIPERLEVFGNKYELVF